MPHQVSQHTSFVDVQHLHFDPVAEHILSQYVIHSAHIQPSLLGCYTQVRFSATGDLTVNKGSQPVIDGHQKHKVGYQKARRRRQPRL